jgi:hypothetical protein
MKKIFCLAFVVSTLSIPSVLAQSTPPQPIPARSVPPSAPPPLTSPGNFTERVNQLIAQTSGSPNSQTLTKFNLDFPGGTPRQLADAIEKSMGKPINIIIPGEYADAKLPPIKVTDVTVPQLFQTVLEGSLKRSSGSGPGTLLSSYGFKAIDGPQTDATIWTFFVYKNQDSLGLTTFNIDFPGGTPKELVTAIQKATSRPLNVIIPPEFADTKLPPLKMNGINVSQLFHALEAASSKVEAYINGTRAPGGYRSYESKMTGYGFKTDGNISDDSIWYFHVEKVPMPPADSPDKISRFYALAPYLERGLKVDDITTAVETAWKMTGETSPPEISFHKDTKLLIAVGDPKKLETIDSVLLALKPESSPSSFVIPPPTPPVKNVEKTKPSE